MSIFMIAVIVQFCNDPYFDISKLGAILKQFHGTQKCETCSQNIKFGFLVFRLLYLYD